MEIKYSPFFSVISFVLFWLSSSFLFSQQLTIKGTVLNSKSKSPIPYVSIDFKKQNVFFIADGAGKFSFSTPNNNLNDTIFFHCMGFVQKSISISDIIKNPNILLDETSMQLNEVTINAQKPKKKTLGKKGVTATFGVPELRLGGEVARLIKSDNYPVKVLKIKMKYGQQFVDSAIIALKIYSSINNMPGEMIFHKEEKITIYKGFNDWIQIDLNKYDLYIDTDFFVSFNFLTELKDKKNKDFFGYWLTAPSFLKNYSISLIKLPHEEKWRKPLSDVLIQAVVSYMK